MKCHPNRKKTSQNFVALENNVEHPSSRGDFRKPIKNPFSDDGSDSDSDL